MGILGIGEAASQCQDAGEKEPSGSWAAWLVWLLPPQWGAGNDDL